jgi:hypothetical protein
MEDMKRAWDEVGDGFSALGRMISERYRDQGGEEPSQPGTGQESAVADAIRRATEELDKAFTSLGDTLRDDEARRQMRETGTKLSDALKVTFTEVSDEIRRAVGNRRSSGSEEPPDSSSTG